MDVSVKKEKGYFASSDKKTIISYYIYAPSEPRAILQISHGMCEYLERYEAHAKFFAERGFVVCGNDHKGHGHSAKRSEELGYTGSADTLVRDVRIMTKIVHKKYPTLPIIVLGHSMGSFIVREYMTRYADGVDGFIISGTAGPENPTALGKLACRLIGTFCGEDHRSRFLYTLSNGSYDKSFKKESPTGAWLTRDADVVKRYKKDSLCNYTFTVNGYYNMFELLGRVSDKNWAKKLKKDMPVLIISGKDDPVGNFGKGVLNVYERMKDAGMTDVKCKLYDGARHEPFNELESVRNEAYADVEAFINKVISARR